MITISTTIEVAVVHTTKVVSWVGNSTAVFPRQIAHSFVYMHDWSGTGKVNTFMTVAVDGNALSDVCGLNLQYHCKTVSRQCKVHSVNLRRILRQKKNQQAKPYDT